MEYIDCFKNWLLIMEWNGRIMKVIYKKYKSIEVWGFFYWIEKVLVCFRSFLGYCSIERWCL